MDMEAAVRTFMDKCGLMHRVDPGLVSSEVAILRLRLMMEELAEVTSAIHSLDSIQYRLKMGISIPGDLTTSLESELVSLADGLADLLYVVVGTAIAYGLPINRIFQEVHRSNMTKAALDHVGKGGKDASFEAPNLLPIIRNPHTPPKFMKDVSGNLINGD